MYTKITRAKHGASAIAYVLQDRGHYKEKRNDILGFVNLDPYTDITTQMSHFWQYASPRHQVQIRRVIISFSDKECERDDECRKQQVMDTVKSGLSKMYPDRQIMLALQTDGKSGYVHIHALINDVSMTDHKGIPSQENNFNYLKENLNRHMESEGFTLDYGKKRETSRKSQYQQYLEDSGKYSWRKDLADRVIASYENAHDIESFKLQLNAHGVMYNDSDNRKYSSFTLCDYGYYDYAGLEHPRKKLTARGDKLDARLTKENLFTHFVRTVSATPDHDGRFYELDIPKINHKDSEKANKAAPTAIAQVNMKCNDTDAQVSHDRIQMIHMISQQQKIRRKESRIERVKMPALDKDTIGTAQIIKHNHATKDYTFTP